MTNPSLSEGALHVERQKIISNKSLLIHSAHVELPSYIQSKVFAYKTWLPPNFRVYNPPRAPKNPEPPVESDEQHPMKEENEVQEAGEILQPQGINVDISEHAGSALPESATGTTNGTPMQTTHSLPLEQHHIPNMEPGEIIEEDTFSDTGHPEQEASASRPATPVADTIDNTAVEPAAEVLTMGNKKKSKNRSKKSKTDDKGTQWLGDKVFLFISLRRIIGSWFCSFR